MTKQKWQKSNRHRESKKREKTICEWFIPVKKEPGLLMFTVSFASAVLRLSNAPATAATVPFAFCHAPDIILKGFSKEQDISSSFQLMCSPSSSRIIFISNQWGEPDSIVSLLYFSLSFWQWHAPPSSHSPFSCVLPVKEYSAVFPESNNFWWVRSSWMEPEDALFITCFTQPGENSKG